MTGVDSEGNKPGISFCLALRCVLDKCANVEEAVRILSNAHFTSIDQSRRPPLQNEVQTGHATGQSDPNTLSHSHFLLKTDGSLRV